MCHVLNFFLNENLTYSHKYCNVIQLIRLMSIMLVLKANYKTGTSDKLECRVTSIVWNNRYVHKST